MANAMMKKSSSFSSGLAGICQENLSKFAAISTFSTRLVQFDAEMPKVPREYFLSKNTAKIARSLLGKLLVIPDENGRRVSGMIVEVEAYLGIDDRAAHSHGGRRTARNEVMYGVGGHVYVFFIYGMYYQLNFVAGPADHPHAILIRGIEPVEGIEIMRKRRGQMNDTNLTSGPGKLAIAFGVTRELNGADLTGARIWLEEHKSIPKRGIEIGPRIGVDYARDDALLPLRYWVKGNPFVSKK
jgi:DNA-3-methyladenine glycosylase